VDSLAYLSVDGLARAVKGANKRDHGYCAACFTANYPVPVEMDATKEEWEVG
jgi:amidophosphoribosyltransferase